MPRDRSLELRVIGSARRRAEVYDEDGNRLHPEISEEFSEDFAAEHGHGHDLSGEMDEGEDDHGEVYGDHTEVRTAPLLSPPAVSGACTGRVLRAQWSQRTRPATDLPIPR
jgi:hypothetical protein